MDPWIHSSIHPSSIHASMHESVNPSNSSSMSMMIRRLLNYSAKNQATNQLINQPVSQPTSHSIPPQIPCCRICRDHWSLAHRSCVDHPVDGRNGERNRVVAVQTQRYFFQLTPMLFDALQSFSWKTMKNIWWFPKTGLPPVIIHF